MDVTLRTRAEEALRIAAVEPAEAVALAEIVAAAARPQRAWETVSIVERALGVAAMHQSRLDDAVAHLRTAVSLGRRAGAPASTGEARMSLASALLLRGEPGRSFRQIGEALTELDGVPAARARTQRAAILQELGRLEEALEDLRRALPVLRRAGDVQWATRALSNRGLLRVSRREFAPARADLLAAQALSREHGLTLPEAIVEHNLAWLESQRGDVPEALQHLSTAEEMFGALGMTTAAILTDRAELLLSVRLLDEALATARAAVAANTESGRANHLPESQLLLSTIALVAGHHDTALSAAEEALNGFVRLGRDAWVAKARYARIQALLEAGAPVRPAQGRRVAEALDAAGWRVPALEALLLAGHLALERGDVDEARTDFARAGRVRRAGPADARARAWLAQALLREAEDNRSGALAALRAGLRVLEDHRDTMGATELRAHVSTHRGAIARNGLRLAVESGVARRVLWWAEIGRTTAFQPSQVRPPSDPVLADLLAELRGVMATIEEGRAAGLSTTRPLRQQVRLEARIRDHTRQAAGVVGDGEGRRLEVRELQDALGDGALVEFAAVGDRLVAVSVTARAVRLHEVGPLGPIESELRHTHFALRRLASTATSTSRVAAAGETLRRAGQRFDQQLVAPLRSTIGDRPLVIVPHGAVQDVPWALLPSCAGRPVSVSPSAQLWHAAAGSSQSTSRIAVVAGPDLPGADVEVRAVADRHPGAEVLLGADATAERVIAALDGADLAHLAAHGLVRGDNPMFSSLALADGPLTTYDLERLRSAPRHVVLAACDSGHSTVVGHGEILGFTAALMQGGTATLVAPLVPVGDTETVSLMVAYHDELLAGRSPAEALAVAQRGLLDGADDRARAAAASFVCLGAG